MSTAPSKRRFTIQEYLKLEQDSATKHEFYRGEIFAMSGGTIRHGDIGGNIYYSLRNLLGGKSCRPFTNDQRICIKKISQYTYSDTFVVCGRIERDQDDLQAITNPRVIFEVLSKSTENYDRGQKWEFYQQLDSLREYLLVSQEEPKVTRYHRDDGGAWHYQLVIGPDQILDLNVIECQLPFAAIYENVVLGPDDTIDEPLK